MAHKSLVFLLKQKSRKTVLSLVTLMSVGLTPVFSISPSLAVNPKVISAENDLTILSSNNLPVEKSLNFNTIEEGETLISGRRSRRRERRARRRERRAERRQFRQYRRTIRREHRQIRRQERLCRRYDCY